MANYNNKDDIKRQQLKNHFLKRIIIRFDFSSIVDIQLVINKIASFLAPPDKYFRAFNQMNIDAGESCSTGTQEGRNGSYAKSIVFRFSDCIIEPQQNVTLDIARDYVCLDIHCNEHYTLIDQYLVLMVEIASIIFLNDPFVQLTRIGIRKINGVDEIDPDDADHVFEYFSQSLDWGRNDTLIQRQYTDVMLCPDVRAIVNYNRIVRNVSGSGNFRFTLDIDCYKDSTRLEKRPSKDTINTYLQSMNDKLFSLFKMGIMLEYFNKNL